MTARTLRFEDKERKTIALHALAFYKVKKKCEISDPAVGIVLQPLFLLALLRGRAHQNLLTNDQRSWFTLPVMKPAVQQAGSRRAAVQVPDCAEKMDRGLCASHLQVHVHTLRRQVTLSRGLIDLQKI